MRHVMTSRHVFWVAPGAVALAALLWQVHVASQRDDRLGRELERLAEEARAPRVVLAPRPTPVFPEAPPPPEPVAEVAPPAPSEEDAARLESARRTVDTILASGALTPQDAARLRAELDALPRAQALAIRKRIAHAINTETLVPTESPVELP
jgi:hypothetical protein